MSETRIGIVGLGLVSEAHLNAFRVLGNVNIVAVCDVRKAIADEVAAEWGAAAYDDYQVMLGRERIDFLMVLTPASTHLDVVRAGARAGAHIFCEKPIAVSLTEAWQIVGFCDSAGVKLFYGSCYRFLPAIRQAYDLIRQGTIGDIHLMTEQGVGGQGQDNCTQLSYVHYPRGGPGGPAWGIMDHGVHLVDVFSWFAQSGIVSVSGQGNISGARPGTEFLTMHFASGAVGHLLYNAATYATVLPNEGMFSGGQGFRADGGISEPGTWEGSPDSISVYGTTGALRIFYYTNALFLNSGHGPVQIPLTGRAPFNHFATQLEACLNAIAGGDATAVDGQVGVDVLETVLQIYK